MSGELTREVQHAWRRLRRAPGFSVTTLVVLALGLGTTTAMFSVVDGIVLRPLPYPESERLVDVSHSLKVSGVSRVSESDGTFLLYQRHNSVFDGIGLYRSDGLDLAPMAGTSTAAERVSATGVSSSLFSVLHVSPMRGRSFVEGEDRSTAPRVVILSERLWRRAFGGDTTVVGKHVVLDGREREVVGIMPASFRFPSASTELWVPLPLDPAHAAPGSFNYDAVARLERGVTMEAAAADLTRILPRLFDEFPSKIPKAIWEEAHVRPLIRPLREAIVGDVTRLLWILFGAVWVVLVIACANAANLFLVRAEGRQRELAIRTALGAGRTVLVTQHLSEALILALGGGALGVGLAAVGLRLLAALPSGIDLPRLAEVNLSARVLLFAATIIVVSAVAVAFVPLLRTRGIPVASVLKDAGRAATAGADRHRVRSALVIAQVALALVLVAASGLMLRSFARLRDVKPGFDAENLLTLRVSLPAAKYRSTVAASQFYDRLLVELRALPGVQEAALTTWLPLTSDGDNGATEVDDPRPAPNAVPAVHQQVFATSNLLAVMRVPIIAGRTLAEETAGRRLLEAVVSRSFAQRYWKDESPLGRRVRPDLSGPWFTIVGVAGDVHLTALEKPADEALYFPLVMPEHDSTWIQHNVSVIVRTSGSASPSTLTASVRQIVHTLDPALPTREEQPMSAVVHAATGRTRFIMLLLGIASSLALVLGAVGIYGVMAYGVSMRQREIGVRMAVGARPIDVSGMIARQGLTLAGMGVIAGLGATFAVTRFLGGLLYDVSATDPLTLAGTCAVLLVVAFLASWLPARRAASVDPSTALRSD
jgi:putative ABC transport system permease protein